MANKIVQAIYDLKDNISGKLSAIGDALRGHQKTSDDTTAKVQSNNQRLSDSYAKAADAVKEAGEKAKDSSTLFGSFKEKLVEIVSIAAAVELALKGIEFGSESLKGAEEVEASLSRVQALAKDAAGQFEQLDEAVESAARAVNVTSQESAAGLAALVTQGLSADTAIKVLIPTLQLAKIANEDVGTAAATVAETLKSFNIPATEAASVVDQLTTASHGAAGGLGAMSGAAAQLAPDAKALKLSFTDIVSVLGVLAASGFDTEKSVRGLRSVFQDLENPTSKLRTDLLLLGDGTNDFSKAIAALNSGTPQAQQALLGLAGPARSLVEALGQAGPEALAKFNAGLQASQGVATATAAALDDNLKGAITRFGNAIDQIGEALAKPILQPFNAELTKLAGQLNDFAQTDTFKDLQASIAQFAKDAAASLDEFLQGVDWKGFAANGEKSIASLSKTFQNLAKNVDAVSTGIGKLADVVAIPFHEVAAAADAAGVAGGKFLGVVTSFAKAGDALSEGAETADKNFKGLQTTFESFSSGAATNLGSHIQSLSDDTRDLAGFTDDATEATTKQGDAATKTAPAVDQHATKAAADASTLLVTSLSLVPDYLTKTGDAAVSAEPGIRTVGDTLSKIGGGPISSAKQALAEAALAFAKLQTSANATPEALQAASDAVLKASRDLDKLSKSGDDSAEALKTAFTGLGVISQEALKQSIKDAQQFFDDIKAGSDQSTAGLTDVANAFLASAQKQLAAAAQVDTATQETTKSSLECQAAALGLTDQLEKLEGQSDKTSTSLANIGRVHPDTSGLKDVTTAANSADEALKGTGESTKSLTDRINDIGTGGFPDLSQALANIRASLLGVSDAAAKLFDAKFYGDFQTAFDATGIGFAKVIGAMSAASAEVTQQITDQRTQLQAEIENINQIGTASGTGFGQFGDNIDAAAAKMKSLSSDIATGNYDAGLLGAQELKPLQDALDAAADRVKQLDDAFQSIVDRTRDALDQEKNDQNAIEARRHQQELDDLKSAAQAANQLNSQAYTQAVARENELHALKMANIKKQQDAQNASSGSGSNSNASGGSNSDSGSGNGASSAAISGGDIHIHLDLSKATLIGSDFNKAADELTAPLVKRIQSLQQRSRVNVITGGKL